MHFQAKQWSCFLITEYEAFLFNACLTTLACLTGSWTAELILLTLYCHKLPEESKNCNFIHVRVNYRKTFEGTLSWSDEESSRSGGGVVVNDSLLPPAGCKMLWSCICIKICFIKKFKSKIHTHTHTNIWYKYHTHTRMIQKSHTHTNLSTKSTPHTHRRMIQKSHHTHTNKPNQSSINLKHSN